MIWLGIEDEEEHCGIKDGWSIRVALGHQSSWIEGILMGDWICPITELFKY